MVITSDLFTVLKERRSVKHYDPSHRMTRAEVEQLLSAAHSAPSSWNLQHWKFFVIDDQAKKEQVLPIAYGQKQVVDSSIIVAVLGDLQANINAEPVYGEAVANGVMPVEVKERLVAQINGAYQSPQVARDEAILNASLAAMQLMLAAKAMGYDTCPMGGFDKGKFVAAFSIPERYIPVMLVVVGKPLKPAYPSSRLPLDQVVFYNEM
jgi:nitroreductase